MSWSAQSALCPATEYLLKHRDIPFWYLIRQKKNFTTAPQFSTPQVENQDTKNVCGRIRTIGAITRTLP